MSLYSLVSIGALLAAAISVAIILYRKKLSQNNEQASLSMKRAYNTVSDAVVMLNRQGRIQYTNTAAMQLLGYDLRSTLSKDFWSLFSFSDLNSKRAVASNVEALLSYPKDRLLLKLPASREMCVSLKVSKAPFNELGDDCILIIMNDMSDLRILESRLRILETYDPLTRLPNRRAIESNIKMSIRESRKHASKHVYCCIGIDQYKYFTDLCGHAAGDGLVKRLSQELRAMVRQNDILAYLNSDEFGVLYRDIEPNVALEMVNQICVRISKFTYNWMGEQHNFTASIGYYVIHKGINTTTQVLYDANLASKIANENGGNRVYVFRSNDDRVSARKGNIIWGRKLKTAFEDNLFQLLAQPIHPLPDSDYQQPFFHYEVLIRMHDRDGQWISPGEFLPAAEHHNMMLLIDKWVVAEVVKHVKLINDANPLPVFSVNLSGHSLSHAHFLEYVLHVLAKSKIDPRMLCFEITETVAVNDLSLATKFINALRRKGCQFSLDDFGTGVSSYGYLKKLDVNFLKIDGSFVKEMETDLVSYEMVRSINQVGHVMGLEVIAEYVENDNIINMLREIGVNHGQGFGICKPEPIENVIKRHIIVPKDGKNAGFAEKRTPKKVQTSLRQKEVVKLQV